MHVVILCDFAVPTGGSQRVAIESARALAEAGVAVTFVHAVAGADPKLDHPMITCVSLDLADVWDRPIAEAAVSGVWSRKAQKLLARTFEGLKPGETILHLHQWTRAFSPAVFAAALKTRLPFVVTAHDYFLACPNGVYYRFDRNAPCALKPLSVGCMVSACDPKTPVHKLIRVMRSIATARAIAGTSFDVVHVSNRGRDMLTPMLPKSLRHHRIDNPIDVERGAAAEIGPDARFAYMGRMTREKGAVVVAEAARLAEVPICFIGDGPAEAEVRAANPSAEILGWRSPSEIAALMEGSIWALVVGSLWFETGPLTVDEASARGVGAIVSNRCGAAERVENEVTGLVVEPSAPALAAAMRRFAEPGATARFGQAAYAKYWANPPTPKAHGAALIALYRNILSRPK